MKFCSDSSFIVRLYDPAANSSETASIHDYLKNDNKVIAVSELCRVEVLNVLLRKPGTGAAELFEEDLNQGLRLRLEPENWHEAFRHAESLARRFSQLLKPG
ncbi:MAG TPA: hypothetical protein VN281_10640, partial [Verrucomicrobiae bacterium]|nr:hypothetical protein [Verrucomicrobiae bacterium]